MGPRGIGTMASMPVVGWLTGKVDTRLLLAIGLGLTAWSFDAMTRWTPDVSQSMVIGVGIVQGVGLSFLFVPLTAAALSTLSPADRNEGSAVYNLARNIGSSVGISVVNALLTRAAQVNHADIARYVTAVNRDSKVRRSPRPGILSPPAGALHSMRWSRGRRKSSRTSTITNSC
jgi:DHA2 family multidrug resistance protein